MTTEASSLMGHRNKPDPRPRQSLAELLSRSMDDDAAAEPSRKDSERERWDDDEGSYSG